MQHQLSVSWQWLPVVVIAEASEVLTHQEGANWTDSQKQGWTFSNYVQTSLASELKSLSLQVYIFKNQRLFQVSV